MSGRQALSSHGGTSQADEDTYARIIFAPYGIYGIESLIGPTTLIVYFYSPVTFNRVCPSIPVSS